MSIKINLLKIFEAKLQGFSNNNIIATYKATKDGIQYVVSIVENNGILPGDSIPISTQISI